MLLQVPKGLGGAKIYTAAVTAAITGTTIMMEYSPGQYLKVLVLEGSLRLSRNGSFGNSLVLHAGKMVIMRPDAKKIPDRLTSIWPRSLGHRPGKLSRQRSFA
jgi:quercetin dioxygenase-like cupin family protein